MQNALDLSRKSRAIIGGDNAYASPPPPSPPLPPGIGARVAFMWVPSHVGLAGNSAADIAAKAALLLPTSNLPVPSSDFCCLIRSHSLKQWQESWNSEALNKLHAIEPDSECF